MSRKPVPRDQSARPTRRVRIMGARIGAITEGEAVRAIIDAATANRGHWTITANLDHIRRYRQEALAKELIDEADLVVADGTPLIWASRLAGTPLPERVAGSTMIWSICEAAGHQQLPVFLLGGEPGVAERAAHVLQERYDGFEIAGTLCPPMGFEKDSRELDRIKNHIAESDSRIVFVALGFPKQDLLIRRLRTAMPHVSFIGVGISLSFVTGEIPRAPNWTHGLGLEWVHRLWQEPRRLIRRYLLRGVPFALLLLTSASWHSLRRGTPARWGWDDGA